VSLFRLDSAEISNRRVRLPIGDSPGYFGHLIPESGVRDFPELLLVAQLDPLSRAFVERLSIGVSQLDLDVFLIGLDCPGTDSEFFCDPVCPEAGADSAINRKRRPGMSTRLHRTTTGQHSFLARTLRLVLRLVSP
jgi:hypothetical protein